MAPVKKKIICLLGSENPTTWILYNHLVKEFGLFPAIIESAISRRTLVRNRIRKLGLWAVAQQLGFIFLIRPWLLRRDQRRIQMICRTHGLEATEPATNEVRRVASVNSVDVQEALQAIRPDVVIVNGTRIIKSATLNSTNALFINTHQGITPQYRGAHGAYWALLNHDPAHCGVTIHLVDEGIDTGNIIDQALIEPTPDDSFVTYSFLQTAAALPLLTSAIHAVFDGKLATRPITGTSGVWYHPGLFQYIMGWWRGVR